MISPHSGRRSQQASFLPSYHSYRTAILSSLLGVNTSSTSSDMVRCVFPVFPILSLCICVYRFGRICAGENQPVFAIGLPLEAHSSTCRRLGLASTGAFAHDAIEWNINTLEAVVKALNRSLVAGGVTGCCVPGLWCNSVDCFTQSITGNFHNFGHLAAYPAYSPVYSCTDRSRTDADLLVTSALATDGKLYLRSSARAFGTDESRVRIHSDSSAADGYGASASCVRTQICSASCAACASNADCPNYGSCIGTLHIHMQLCTFNCMCVTAQATAWTTSAS